MGMNNGEEAETFGFQNLLVSEDNSGGGKRQKKGDEDRRRDGKTTAKNRQIVRSLEGLQ